MMVGEFDYTNILVDVQNSYNNKTGAPYVPFPEVSYVFFYLFVITMSVALMNLLVSITYYVLRVLHFFQSRSSDAELLI